MAFPDVLLKKSRNVLSYVGGTTNAVWIRICLLLRNNLNKLALRCTANGECNNDIKLGETTYTYSPVLNAGSLCDDAGTAFDTVETLRQYCTGKFCSILAKVRLTIVLRG